MRQSVSTATSPSDGARDPALDGVRGLAVALVLLFHCFTPEALSPISTAFSALFGSLFIGVDLFFVLSGFLITGILVRTRRQPGYFSHFILRRALRIFPAYFLVLLAVLLLGPLALARFPGAELWQQSPWFFLFAQNWMMAISQQGAAWPGLNHFWSLAIEEQFYLFWPLVVWFTPPKRMAAVCLATAALSVALKLALLIGGAHWLVLYTATPAHMEGLALGGLIAVLLQQQQLSSVPRWVHALGALSALVLLALICSRSGYKLGSAPQLALHNLFAALSFAWLLLLLVGPGPAALRLLLSQATLRWLGQYSYGIYLIHYAIYWPLKSGMAALLPDLPVNLAILLLGVAVTALTLLLAVAMYHAVEMPAQNLARSRPALRA